ncbi:MAG: hypothetical protein K6U04_07685 [Armatimonadetes bacterium]|nr:hypothetical protein [Armatimonadota bacterium]
MAIALEKMKDRLEKALERPFYEAEMARVKNYRTKKEDILIVLLVSFTLLWLGLLI